MRNKKQWAGLIESVESPTSVSSLQSIMWLSQVWLGPEEGGGTVLFVLQVFFDGVQLLTLPSSPPEPATRPVHGGNPQWSKRANTLDFTIVKPHNYELYLISKYPPHL